MQNGGETIRLFSNDTGLLTGASNNGAHFENAVAQQLTVNGLEPYFSQSEKSSRQVIIFWGVLQYRK